MHSALDRALGKDLYVSDPECCNMVELKQTTVWGTQFVAKE